MVIDARNILLKSVLTVMSLILSIYIFFQFAVFIFDDRGDIDIFQW